MINVKLRVPSYKYKIKIFNTWTSNMEKEVNSWLDANDIVIESMTHMERPGYNSHTIMTILYKDIQKE